MDNPLKTLIVEIEKMQAEKLLTGEVDTLLHVARKLEKEVFGILKRPYRFEIFRGKDKQFYGRMVAPNGKTMDVTEGMKARLSIINNYKRKQAAYLCSEIVDV